MSDLIERLRAVDGDGDMGESHLQRWWLVNPDGPEAAKEIERLQARVRELEADPRMALTYDDLARFAASTRSESLSIYDAAAMRWRRLIAARDAALAAVSAEKEKGS